jgi:hypothetical protein
VEIEYFRTCSVGNVDTSDMTSLFSFKENNYCMHIAYMLYVYRRSLAAEEFVVAQIKEGHSSDSNATADPCSIPVQVPLEIPILSSSREEIGVDLNHYELPIYVT